MLPPLPVVFMWPLAVIVFFKRFSLPVAISVSIIAGYLLLPGGVRFNLPMLPPISKDTIPSFAVLCGVLMLYGRPSVNSLPGWLPNTLLGKILVIGSILGIVMTVFTNGDRLAFINNSVPGLRPYDIFSSSLTFIVTLLPFLIGRKFLASTEAHKGLLTTLSIAGALYAVLAVYEIRFSPQLNNMIYGFYPAGWIQNIRGDGFRPFVFVGHGLKLGIFLSCAVLATLALALRGNPAQRLYFWGAFIWIFGVLFLTKAFGALLITLVLIPLIFLFGIRLQMIAAGLIAGAVLLYPMLRGANVIPVDQVVSFARSIDNDRGGSLQYRLNNEDILLDKALARPLFGWGGWGRARVYNENGRDISTTDGLWIITIGEGGWVGYLGRFGLLCGPIILLAWRRRSQVGPETAALSIVLAANLIDMVPNAGLTPITWLMAGALMGRFEAPQTHAEDLSGPSPEQDRKPQYSRTQPRALRHRQHPASRVGRQTHSRKNNKDLL